MPYKDKEFQKKYWKEYSRKDYLANPEKFMLKRGEVRAKNLGLEFNLDITDIVIPAHCPILGIKLKLDNNVILPTSPSLDRVDNSKGYIKGNVRVISQKANACKSNLSVEDIENLYKYVKGLL
jgi:hypothetical protein